MSNKTNVGVVGITHFDNGLLQQIIDKENVDRGTADKSNKRRWISCRITEAYVAAFGKEQYQIERKKWIEDYLGEAPIVENF